LLSFGWLLRKWRAAPPTSLLDNTPLAGLLHRMLDLPRLDAVMSDGLLHALAVTASSYTGGNHVTFYQTAADIAPWIRMQRIAMQDQIGVEHLLASSAIPFIFPAVPLFMGSRREYCGDGSMRQLAPISPAIHLGAHRILVIGAGRMREPPGPREQQAQGYPSIAQIGGHALSSIFLDSLAVDAERLQRINGTLALVPPQVRAQAGLRPIELLLISPTQRLDDIAARHVGALPHSIRALLAGIGVSGANPGGGAALASYLLFESDYTRELLALGEADTMAREGEVRAFFRL
jgi:NTE family protein